MADLMSVVHLISTPIKGAWILWLVWSVVQVGWYRRAQAAARTAPSTMWSRFEQPRKAPWSERSTEETQIASESLASAESATAFGGGFISLGLDGRHSPSPEQPIG